MELSLNLSLLYKKLLSYGKENLNFDSTLNLSLVFYSIWDELFFDQETVGKVNNMALKYTDYNLKSLKEILKETLERQKEKSSLSELQGMAFWDFDGTILDGDIAEGWEAANGRPKYHGMMEEVFLQNFLPFKDQTTKEKFWQNYRQYLQELRLDKAYFYMVEVLEQLSETDQKTVEHLAGEAFQNFLKDFFFQSTLELMDFLKNLGVENYIISASPHLFVKAASKILSLPEKNISGITLKEFPLINYGPGKAQRVKNILQKSKSLGQKSLPLLAAGNSWKSDGPMCREVTTWGGIGLLINAGQTPEDFLGLVSHQNIFEAGFTKIKRPC